MLLNGLSAAFELLTKRWDVDVGAATRTANAKKGPFLGGAFSECILFTPEVFNYRLTAICSPRSSLPVLRRCQKTGASGSLQPRVCPPQRMWRPAALGRGKEQNAGGSERRSGSSESQRGSSVTEMNRPRISEIHAGDARSAAHEGIICPSCLSAQLNILHISSAAGK